MKFDLFGIVISELFRQNNGTELSLCWQKFFIPLNLNGNFIYYHC